MLIIFVLNCFITALVSLVASFLAFWKAKEETIKRIFSLFSFAAFIWSMGLGLEVISSKKDIALFWSRFLHVGVIFVTPAYLHTCLILTDLNKRKRKLIIAIYIYALVLLILNFFPLIVKGVSQKFYFNYYTDPGILYPFLLLLFFSCMGYGFFVLISALKKKGSDVRRKQIKYFLIGTILGYIGGTPTYLPVSNIYCPPYAMVLLPIYYFFLAYAIIRYHLLEIEVIIRKTLVFAGLSAFVFGAFVGTAYLAQTFWTKVNGSEYLAMAIAVLIIVLVQEPLKNILIKYTDRFLLQKKYDYQKILKDASEGMAMVRELKWLLGLITHIVSSKMRVSNIGIFLQEDDGDPNHYYLKAKRGKESIEQNFLSSDNPVCLWLKENKRPLVLEEVVYLLQRKNIASSESSLKNILVRIKNQMEGLNAKIILPSFYKGGLLGFLSLGYKLSGDIYTKEDLVLLSTLSNSSAIAIENARLFDNLIDEIEINNHLRKEEEESYMQMMMSLAKTIDAKDSYTYDHVEMVYQYGIDLTQYLPGVNKDALKASLRLHDLGKIGVPDSILSKQGPLTPEEWKKIKDHTILGARILAPLKRFEYVAKVILHHQEKFDGTGYPAGLKGDQIPLESRIIAVVDAYHAMVSDRPYRKALPKHAAIAELRKFAGTQFDPIVVEAFLKLLEEKYGITETA